MSKQAHPYKQLEEWAEAKFRQYGPKLAEGKYPPPEKFGPIPEIFFQHPAVQAKFAEMRQSNMNPENKQRIPEKYKYYSPKAMMKYIKELASTLPEAIRYSVFRAEEQPNTVIFESPPKEIARNGKNTFPITNKFKIHLMFNVTYMDVVLPLLFNELIATGFPVVFKLLNFNPVTAIINRAGLPNPTFDNVKYDNDRLVSAVDYNYGTNNAKKGEYGRLAESFIYSPTEIKKYQVMAKFDHMGTPLQSSTFRLDGTTKKNTVINDDQYDIESVFDPVIVFYIKDDSPSYTQDLLQRLLRIFPDEMTREWVLPHFYPRGNVKINNMIYLANGDFGTKFNKKMKCTYYSNGPVCSLNPNDGKLLDLPTEYQAIQGSCSSRVTKPQCDAANRLPLAVSDHKLCKWKKDGNANEGKCTPEKTYSQHLLLQDYDSLEQLYDDIGQREVLERFKAGTKNESLPVNYGGRRTRRNKRNTRKTRSKRKNKSRRNH